MFKRLLLSGLALVGPYAAAWVVFFILDDVFIAEYTMPKWAIYTPLYTAISGIPPLGIYTFLKVKTKNTLVEDIIVNQVKIMKAKQEAKLKELQGGDQS